ncbi:ubiquitin-protein ligase, putative [Plasmodium gallinaceum]|uniref:HECT-type E3 ubiquitin transferase n=1 Tax=Plasmodium gallinaceum TaxID=5849 RepID=A0A1J1GUV9_PLAGA|nr:ubiquitin-protein ligase, putative [Plasmodium gallinaceum]CRG96242.1 ubiquitin-protein ligase, putative [Plasmodium gallinaceum]
MFNGESKNRRINLSGKKHVILNKDCFIEKAKKEKEINLTLTKRKNAFKVIALYFSYKKFIENRRKEIDNVLSKRINDVILLEKIVSPDVYRQALQICLYEFSVQSTFLYSELNCYNHYKYMKFDKIYAPIGKLLDILKLYNKIDNIDDNIDDNINLNSQINNKKKVNNSQLNLYNENENKNDDKNIYIKLNKENSEEKKNNKDICNLVIKNKFYYRHKKEIKILINHLDILLGNYYMCNLNIYNEFYKKEKTVNDQNYMRDCSNKKKKNDINLISHLYYIYNFVLNNSFNEELAEKLKMKENKNMISGNDEIILSLKKIGEYIILNIEGLITVIKKIYLSYKDKNIIMFDSIKLMMYICDMIFLYFYIIKIKGNDFKKDYIIDLKYKINLLLNFLLLNIPFIKDHYYLFLSFFKYQIYEIFMCNIELKNELKILKGLLIIIIKNTYKDIDIMKELVYNYVNVKICNNKFHLLNQKSFDNKNISGVNLFKNLLLFVHFNKELLDDNVLNILLELYLLLPFDYHPYIYMVNNVKNNVDEKYNSNDMHIYDVLNDQTKIKNELSVNKLVDKDNKILNNKNKNGKYLEMGYYYNKNIIDSLIYICKKSFFKKLDALLFLLLPFRSIHIHIYEDYRNYYDYIKNINKSSYVSTNVNYESINLKKKIYEYQSLDNNNNNNFSSCSNMHRSSVFNNLINFSENKNKNFLKISNTTQRNSNINQLSNNSFFFSLNNLISKREKKGKGYDMINNEILLRIKKILVSHNIHIYLIKKIYLFWFYDCKSNDTLFFRKLLAFPYFDNTCISIYFSSFCFLLYYYIIVNMYNKLIDIKNYKYTKNFMMNKCFKKVCKLLVLSLWVVLKGSINTIHYELINRDSSEKNKHIEKIEEIADEDIYNDEDEEYEREMNEKEEENIEKIENSELSESNFDLSVLNFEKIEISFDKEKNIFNFSKELTNDIILNENKEKIENYKKGTQNINKEENNQINNNDIYNSSNNYKNDEDNFMSSNINKILDDIDNLDKFSNLNENNYDIDNNINENNKLYINYDIYDNIKNNNNLSNKNYNDSSYTSNMINYYLYNNDNKGLSYVLPLLLKKLYKVNSYINILEEDFFVIKETYNLLKNRFNIIGESNNINYNSNSYDEDSSLFIEKNDIYLNNNIKYVNVLANYLLKNAPFTLPFDDRILIFYHFRNKSKENIRDDSRYNFLENKHNLIRRTNILEDAFITLHALDSVQLKQNIRIAFIDKNGNEETGIDGGGLFKEFIILLCREVFHNNFILFQNIKNNTLFPKTYNKNDNLNLYEFSGKIVGKAIYERILIESVFNKVFLNLLLFDDIDINDLYFIDENIFNSLLYIQNTNDVENLSLTFCIYEKKCPDDNIKKYEEIKNYFNLLSKNILNNNNRNNVNNLLTQNTFHYANMNNFFNIIDNLDVLINTLNRNLSSFSQNNFYVDNPYFTNSASILSNRNMTNLNITNENRENTNLTNTNTNDKENNISNINENNVNYFPNENDENLINTNFTKEDLECIDLIENGRNIIVNDKNKKLYIKLYINYKYNKLIKKKTEYFLKGLSQLIPTKWFKLFSPNELKTLISGNDKCFDVDDLRRNVVYGGGYNENSQTVLYLFDILKNFSPKEKSLFLMFVTSCSRSPLLGFQELNPKFCIFRVRDYNRLPTASTCVNLLKLPDYLSKEILYKNLITAINDTQGFDLS